MKIDDINDKGEVIGKKLVQGDQLDSSIAIGHDIDEPWFAPAGLDRGKIINKNPPHKTKLQKKIESYRFYEFTNLDLYKHYELYGHIPEIVKGLIRGCKGGAILAGGALRAAFDGTQVMDYDIFFTNKSHVDFVKMRLESIDAKIIYDDSETGLTSYQIGCMKIQLIYHEYFNDPIQLLKGFDIVAAMMALTSDSTGSLKYWACPSGIKDAKRKIINVFCPNLLFMADSLGHIMRYREKGYSRWNEAILDTQELSLNQYNVIVSGLRNKRFQRKTAAY